MMQFKNVVYSALFCALWVFSSTSEAVVVDEKTLLKLIKKEEPVIETKNGRYIFVPSSVKTPSVCQQTPQTAPVNQQKPTENSSWLNKEQQKSDKSSSNSKGNSNQTPPKSSSPNSSSSCSNQLRGINRSGGEYSCVQNLGIFEGPVDDSAVKKMKSWNINAVRVPLNEDCWLGINGHNAAYIGNNYKNAVVNYVNILRKNGLQVILDLHWTGGIYGGKGQGTCYDKTAKCQKPMPNKNNSPKFWHSVASQFKGDTGIIFDLFNEPFPDMVISDISAAWKCWRDGGSACPGFQYEVAGMQDLVNAVRSAGAKNQVMLGGITWANDLSRWQDFVPKDSANNIAASWHSYDFNACNNQNCWESKIAPVAKKYPVIAGEIGQHGCRQDYIMKVMNWLDTKNISYLGWTWNTWDCSSGPALITDYNGSPTEFGKGLKNHLASKKTCPVSPISESQSTIAPPSSSSNSGTSGSSGSQKSSSSAKPGMTSSGKRLRGVNRSGTEYACVQNNGIFEGPIDDKAIKSMKSWNINVVRIPLNEDCWLGINGHNAAYIGNNYQNSVLNYVKALRSNDLKVVLDLHWTGGIYGGPGQGTCYDKTAKCQKPMPNKENSPKFWQSVANKFKSDEGIIFDLFNEPFPDMIISDKSSAWKCWRDGGSSCPGFQYEVAGMQDLVNAVRSTGAKNQVMAGGLTWANDLSRWQEFVPKDSANNIAAAWHSYDFNACNNQQCWNSQIAPLAAKYPVIAGEIGQHGCKHDYVDTLMKWLDDKKISYLGWTWNTWDCSSGPALISNYDGTPTDFGKGLKNHLQNTVLNHAVAEELDDVALSKLITQIEQTPTIPTKNGYYVFLPNPQCTNCLTKNPSSKKSSGSKKQLRGVNRSGAEYSCVKNLGIFEGPVDDSAVKNMNKWNINAVRIPLNEECWLGVENHPPAYTGENYRNAVTNYVNILRQNNLTVILDLHWSHGLFTGAGCECQKEIAYCQKPMPNAKYTPSFWKSVADRFKNDDNIIFDLFNEPFPDMVYWDKAAVWKCWRDGGDSCSAFPYRVSGMQDLVDAVRSVGATNPVMVGGINWSSDLSQWKQYVPVDPLKKVIASWHAYALNSCNNTACWEKMISPVAEEYQVVVGEMGETDCTHEYVDKLMSWLDGKGISYLGWTWNTWDCRSGPALIQSYDGTPTGYGEGLRNHFNKFK